MGVAKDFWDVRAEDFFAPGLAAVQRELEAHQAATDYIRVIRRAAGVARQAATPSDPKLAGKLIQFADRVDALSGKLERAHDAMIDIRAVNKMVKAWRSLDKAAIVRDPKAAAYAFGALFEGAGRIARHLPAPLDEFGSVLEALGGDLIWGTARGLNPYMDPTTQRGAQVQEIERQSGGQSSW